MIDKDPNNAKLMLRYACHESMKSTTPEHIEEILKSEARIKSSEPVGQDCGDGTIEGNRPEQVHRSTG